MRPTYNLPIAGDTEEPRTGGQPTPIDKGSPGVFKHIELEINTACDLACFGCDRFSDVTTAPNMTLEQVKLFVDESLELGWRWERIRFLGGEPTLHPRFRELCGELIRYREHHQGVKLQVLSNGLGRLDRHRQWMIDNWIDPHVEAKTKGQTPRWFVNTRIVPADRDPGVGELEPCGIFGVHGCGIGLTRHGYFLDGAGASIARITGHDVGIMWLKDVTWDAMLAQAKVLCRICGHWNPTDHQETKKVTETGEVTGNFWREALARYDVSKPVLRIYGEGREG